MCHHIFMYIREDKNTNFYIVHVAQTKCSIEYISNTYGCVNAKWEKNVSN